MEVLEDCSDNGRSRGSKCVIPILDNAKMEFKPNDNHKSSEFILSFDVSEENDRIWLCTTILSELKQFKGISSTYPLRKILAEHYNSLPPDTGCDAELSANLNIIDTIFSGRGKHYMSTLQRDGFIVVDSGIQTSPRAFENLSQLLIEKTGQDDSIRSDTVAFITEIDAVKYGVGAQFKSLMAITSYLNDNIKFEPTVHSPLHPGTQRKPLTNPKDMQIAEYIEGEFYKEHR